MMRHFSLEALEGSDKSLLLLPSIYILIARNLAIGKMDKFSREIYEGDWVYQECCSPDDPAYGHYGETYEVRWSAFSAGFDLAQNESAWPKQEDGYAYCSGLAQSEELEIRGNIYQNPSE